MRPARRIAPCHLAPAFILAAALGAGGPALPEGLSEPAVAVAVIAVAMAALWVSEAIPLAATALIPLAAFPVLGIVAIEELGRAYAHPLIFLFLGGFLIARTIESWGLHRRLAYSILRLAGRSPGRILAAVMAATGFLSLWISNTASAMMMAPIAASLLGLQGRDDRFATALMLGVAFAATIGGIGSLIGTPPNALFAAYMAESHGVQIGFAAWMAVGLPIVLVMMPLTWLVLARIAFRIGSAPVEIDFAPAQRWSAAERRVALIAGLTALGWIARPALVKAVPGLALSDAGIAVAAAVALFAIPAGQGTRRRLLDWDHAKTIRWDVLILVGGGLALSRGIEETGLAAWMGAQMQGLSGVPTILLLAAIAAVIVYVGELASNTAMAAIFLPVAGAAALGIGTDALVFTLPVALAASIGFMLPVATPPNAIVFGNPAVAQADMLRAGALLDPIGIVVALAIGTTLGPLVFAMPG